MNVVDFPKVRQGGGYYSVGEAAIYLRLRSAGPVRNWAFGNKNFAPVINRQYIESRTEIGFYDLLEIRFISYFRKAGISLQSIRKVAQEARRELRQTHPFATDRTFMTDRKRIFMIVAEQTGDKRMVDLATGQTALYDILENSLAKGVVFDPITNLGRVFKPDQGRFPSVQMSPEHAFGHPVVARSFVPTRVLYQTYRAENNSIAAAATWFEVADSLVQEAIEFEIEFAAEAA